LHILDAGHWVQLDVPEEVAEHLLKDLSQNRSILPSI
jgi:pimeloyl-ACP methyl ester carboxylesterase